MKPLILPPLAPATSHDQLKKKLINQYKDEFNGCLPATTDELCLILARTAPQWSRVELSVMLRSLSQWHRDHTFTDPTVRPSVIRLCAAPALAKTQKTVFPFIHPPTVVELIQLNRIECNRIEDARRRMRQHLADGKLKAARQGRQQHLQAIRDNAILLLSYWYSLEPSHVSRLTFEDLVMKDGTLGIHIRGKESRLRPTITLTLPRFPRYCPVEALEHWINESGIHQGALFQAVDGEVLTGAMRSADIASHLTVGAKQFLRLPKGMRIAWRDGILAYLIDNHWEPEDVVSVFRQHHPRGIRDLARNLQACKDRRFFPPIAETRKILAIYAALKQ